MALHRIRLVGFVFVAAVLVASIPLSLWRRPNEEYGRLKANPNHVDAIERVRSYIADAHAWELDAMPPRDPVIDEALRAQLQQRKISLESTLMERMKERGRFMLDARNEYMEKLAIIAEAHWIGDEWIHEADVLSSPPKHDPKNETVIEAKSRADGSVEIIAMFSADSLIQEKRIYRVERHAGVWRIRSYNCLRGEDK